MAFGASGEGFAAPPSEVPGLEHWFAQVKAQIDGLTSSSIGLGDLADVSFSGLASGDFVRFDGSNWVNTTLVAGDIPNLDASKITTGTFADARIAQSNVTQHQAALAIAFTQLTGSIADGQVPQSAVTQHEGALTILESQITDGSILARLAGSETITGAWTYTNLLTINRGSNEQLQLKHSSATGSPYLSFYQSGTRRAFIQYNDAAQALRFRSEETGIYQFQSSTGARVVLTIDDSPPHLHVYSSGNEMLRLDDTSATGSPMMTFYQNGSMGAKIQYLNVLGGIRIEESAGGNNWDFKSNGDFEANDGDVIATGADFSGHVRVAAVAADSSVNWAEGNVQTITNSGSRTITFSGGQNGGTYILAITRAAGAAGSWTWPTVNWVGNAAPGLSTVAGSHDIIYFTYANSEWYGAYTLDHR